MSDIFREIDEDLRKDDYQKIWRTYGPYAIALATLIVLATAGYQGWKAYQNSRQLEDSVLYLEGAKLLQQGLEPDAAAKFGELAESGTSGYRILALMQQAGALVAAGKPDEAVFLYEQVAEDPSHDQQFRQLATLKAAILRADADSYDQMQNRIGELARSNSPWRFTAIEILAYSAFRTNRLDVAKEGWRQLLDDFETPASIKERAQDLLSIVGEDVGEINSSGLGGQPPEDLVSDQQEE